MNVLTCSRDWSCTENIHGSVLKDFENTILKDVKLLYALLLISHFPLQCPIAVVIRLLIEK